MINKIEFSKRLTDLRTKCGLSQNRLAEMLFISGQAISKWETGSSLPYIELLIPLAQILGVSVDYLIGNDISVIAESLTSYDTTDENITLLTAMSDTLSREYLYKTAKYIEHDKLKYTMSLTLTADKNVYTHDIDIKEMTAESLKPLSRHLSNLTLRAINESYNPVQEITDYMRCPNCGSNLTYVKETDCEYLMCDNNHRYDINEGVVDFKTLEMPGFTWSSWIRRYEDFKKNNSEYYNSELRDNDYKMCLDELRKDKPKLIIDIGTGMMGWASRMVRLIDWECVLVLTDLSHRILKYDKRYVDEVLSNPKVKVVYLACDVRNLPFKDNTVDNITSMGGFESVMYDYVKAYQEIVRVLKNNHKALFDITYIADRNSADSIKWLKLIKDDGGDIMTAYYDMIFDLNEFAELIPSYGFSNHTLTVISEPISPPDTDVFPYDSQISRWMGCAFVIARK
jgi:Predicted transcriptional regulators